MKSEQNKLREMVSEKFSKLVKSLSKVRFLCRDGVLEYEKRAVIERSTFMAHKVKFIEDFCNGPYTIDYTDFDTEVVKAYLAGDWSTSKKVELLSFLEYEGKITYSGSRLIC